jgi:hypothetical protein
MTPNDVYYKLFFPDELILVPLPCGGTADQIISDELILVPLPCGGTADQIIINELILETIRNNSV